MTEAQPTAPAKAGFHPPVFYPASLLIIVLVAFAALAPDTANTTFKSLRDQWGQSH